MWISPVHRAKDSEEWYTSLLQSWSVSMVNICYSNRSTFSRQSPSLMFIGVVTAILSAKGHTPQWKAVGKRGKQHSQPLSSLLAFPIISRTQPLWGPQGHATPISAPKGSCKQLSLSLENNLLLCSTGEARIQVNLCFLGSLWTGRDPAQAEHRHCLTQCHPHASVWDPVQRTTWAGYIPATWPHSWSRKWFLGSSPRIWLRSLCKSAGHRLWLRQRTSKAASGHRKLLK